MQSHLPKVLQKVKGKAMIVRLIEQVVHLAPSRILIVVGIFKDIIQAEIDRAITDQDCLDLIDYAIQPEPLGTGDAIKATLKHLPDPNSINIIINGDVPLLQYSTLSEIYEEYLSHRSSLMLTAINLADPSGCGRIMTDINGMCTEIIEEKDCTEVQRNQTLVNCGIYICSVRVLQTYIPLITNNNAQSEYYLTDLIKIYKEATHMPIDLYILGSEREIEIYNVNTKAQLEYVEQILSERENTY